MNKLIPLILLTTFVGCAEYSSYEDCFIDEMSKLKYTPDENHETEIRRYCYENFN